jgi:fucose 4-O-acetylase-like acetyltransferase
MKRLGFLKSKQTPDRIRTQACKNALNLQIMNDYKTESRDVYMDNAKAVLMLLVVIGHTVEPVMGSSGVDAAFYVFIYSFHMPMFALLSGFFSSQDMSWASFKKIVLRLLPPYLIFQSFLILLAGICNPGKWAEFSLLEPYYAMWYLISLLTWRALLPIFSKFKFPILMSLFLALLCGYIPSIDRYLSLSRTLVLLPFFLLGFYARQKKVQRLLLIIPPNVGITLLVLGGFLAVYYRWVDARWLWHADGYAVMGYEGWPGAVFRLLSLSVAIILGLAFFSVVPKSETALTRIGRQTLYVYLLHFLAIRILFDLGFYSKMTGPLALCVLVPLGVLMWMFLSQDRVLKAAAPFVDPISTLARLSKSDAVPRREELRPLLEIRKMPPISSRGA